MKCKVDCFAIGTMVDCIAFAKAGYCFALATVVDYAALATTVECFTFATAVETVLDLFPVENAQ